MGTQSTCILGAGGKMGCRLIDNLLKWPERYRLLPVEISDAGRANLAQRGLSAIAEDEALGQADVVILALPDRLLGRIAAGVIPKMRPGALVMTLDPAAPHAGEIPIREDLGYFVTHPCHPTVFNYEATPEERRDFFGGVKAKQNIVCALMHGSEEDYARGEAIARDMYGPVLRSHRITVEQMAILEPTMAETVTIACITVIREAMEEAIKRGVPREAAFDFLMGHINIPLAVIFGEVNSPLSDGCKVVMEMGRQRIFQPDWKKLFEPESVREQVLAIVNQRPPSAA